VTGEFPAARPRAAWAALRKRAAEAARAEAARVPGVVAVTEAAVKGRGFGRDSDVLEAPRLRASLGVVLEYGPEMPDIIAEVRECAARAAESVTGCPVAAVDVLVADLYVRGELQAERGSSVRPAGGARIDF